MMAVSAKEMTHKWMNRNQKRKMDGKLTKEKMFELEKKLKEECIRSNELEKNLIELDSENQKLRQQMKRKEQLYRDHMLDVIDNKNREIKKVMKDQNMDIMIEVEQEEPSYHFTDIEGLHNQILQRIENKKYSTKQLLIEKENEVTHRYDEKLAKLRLEIQNLKANSSSSSSSLQNKIGKLQEENMCLREISSKNQLENKDIRDENSSLNQQISQLINDREFLLRQIINLKKENKNLHLLVVEQKSNCNKEMIIPKDQENNDRNLKSFRDYDVTNCLKSNPKIDQRYNAIIHNLKTQIKNEKSKNTKLSSKLNNYIRTDSEIKKLMKLSINQVQKKLKKKYYRKKSKHHRNKNKLTVDFDDELFKPESMSNNDRNEIFKKLILKEKILQLIQREMFPNAFKIWNHHQEDKNYHQYVKTLASTLFQS